MHILIAPNAFKHSLNASDAALAIQKGLVESELNCTSECFPIGDGGDGTVELLITLCGGSWIDTLVHDALGRPISARFGLIDNGETAVIEMANASGIRLIRPEELKPLKANSVGTGEQIKIALDQRVKRIIIGMGGSATVDGGCGMLKALGVRFLDADGNELSKLPGDLSDLASIDYFGLDKRFLDCEVIVLCDVDNPLIGAEGAARIFGPQKGATIADVRSLEEALGKFAAVVLETTGKHISAIKHGGTAGGAAAGLYAFLNAKLVNGIDYFLTLTNFSSALDAADLVITGEGSIDEQTLKGKGPFGVASLAKKTNLPVVCFAGKVPLETKLELDKYFDVLMPISHDALDLESALKYTEENLIRTSKTLGNLVALSNGFTSKEKG